MTLQDFFRNQEIPEGKVVHGSPLYPTFRYSNTKLFDHLDRIQTRDMSLTTRPKSWERIILVYRHLTSFGNCQKGLYNEFSK